MSKRDSKGSSPNPDQQIDATLAALARKHGAAFSETANPLAVLVAKDEESDLLCRGESEVTVWEAKAEAMRSLLDWVFEKGADPRIALRRLYALAHEVGPQLLRDLTHEEIALLLGDGAGRATSSARTQAIFGGLKSALGMTTDFGGMHKTVGARERMSQAQRGNRNRTGGKSPRLSVIEGVQPKAKHEEAA